MPDTSPATAKTIHDNAQLSVLDSVTRLEGLVSPAVLTVVTINQTIAAVAARLLAVPSEALPEILSELVGASTEQTIAAVSR
jgi:hypothetical protein